MKRLLATCSVCALMGLAAPAHASIILALIGTPTADGAGFDYTYGATLSQDQQMDPSVGTGVFFTLYDFGATKLVNTSGNLSGSDWKFTLNTEQTTAALGTLPNNDPSILDVRATYSGPVVTTNTVGTGLYNLGTFTLFTAQTGPYEIFINDQDAQLSKYAPGSPTNNSPTSNLAAVAEPSQGRSVPEPASIAVIGMGLLGLGAVRGRKNRAS